MAETLDDRIAAVRGGAEREVIRLLGEEEQRLAELGRRLEAVSAELAVREDELRRIAAGLGVAMEGFRTELERLEGLGPMPSVARGVARATVRPEQAVRGQQAASSLSAAPADLQPTPAEPAPHADVEGEPAVPRTRLRRMHARVDAHEARPWGRGPDSDEALDRARLTALDMAARGRSRDEVVAHVRDGLGVSDPGAIIDYVFGASTPSSVVPGWPPRRRLRRSA